MPHLHARSGEIRSLLAIDWTCEEVAVLLGLPLVDVEAVAQATARPEPVPAPEALPDAGVSCRVASLFELIEALPGDAVDEAGVEAGDEMLVEARHHSGDGSALGATLDAPRLPEALVPKDYDPDTFDASTLPDFMESRVKNTRHPHLIPLYDRYRAAIARGDTARARAVLDEIEARWGRGAAWRRDSTSSAHDTSDAHVPD